MATVYPVTTAVANGELYNEGTVRGKLAALTADPSFNGRKLSSVAAGSAAGDVTIKSQMDTATAAAQAAAIASSAASLAAGVKKVRRVIVQPADDSDFFVTIPGGMLTDTYEVAPCMVNGVAAVVIQCPDLAPTDRTTTQFRVLTSAPLANGDSIAFIVLA